MKNGQVDLGKLPAGLIVIKYVYAAVSLIFAFSAVFFSSSTNVSFCGTPLGDLPSILINSVLVLFPLLLYFSFNKPTITTWYLAFLYHIFFIGNSALTVLSTLLPESAFTPLIQITTEEPILPFSLKLFSVFNITMLLGIFILAYLWQKKEYFMPKSILKNI